MKVIGIVASRRKKGNTSVLVAEALKSVESEGIETEIIYLGDYDIKACTACEGCRKTYKCVIKDGMQSLYPKIMESDGLIAASPTYFYNISSDMKAFIERMYCYEIFDGDDRSVWMSVNEAMGGKLAATIAICEQEDVKDMGFTSEAMDLSLASLGYRIVDSVKILKLYEIGAAERSDKAISQARNAGRKLARTLKLKESIIKKINNN